MAAGTWIKQSGVWVQVDAVHVKAAGVWQPLDDLHVKSAGGWQSVLDTFRPLSISLSETTLYKEQALASDGDITSPPLTYTITGGTPPYEAYLNPVSGSSSIDPDDTTYPFLTATRTFTFTAHFGSKGTKTRTFAINVNDSLRETIVVSPTITVTLKRI